MVPALPVANLVVGQARFALGTLDTFFDAMFGFCRASEFRYVCIRTRVGQVVIGLQNTTVVAVFEADRDQDLFVAFLPFIRARDNASLDHLDHERTFRTIAHVDFGPFAFVKHSNPLINACPRPLRIATSTRVSRRINFQVADLCVGRNGLV